jgi:uncharacterized protein (DUF2147 family)
MDEIRESTRRDDIDWLRVGATYLLFVFHGAMVFNPAPFYHIRNDELSFAMLVLCGFVGLWHMPLFFVLAGWSIAPSLAARGVRGFMKERFRKLAVPLVAGCIFFGPVLKYLELRTGLDLNHAGLWVSAELQESFAPVAPGGLPVAAPFRESFLEFLPTYFTDLERFTWSHLWFLAYLFTFSMLYRPLLSWMLERRGRLRVPGAAAVYLPMVPLALIQLVLRPRWPGIQNLYDDWANVAYYSVYFLAGLVLATQPALERAVEREWRRALGVGIAAALVLLVSVLGLVRSEQVLLAGSAVAGWGFVVAIVGMAPRFLSFTNGALRYLRHSAFPVYVLHQAAIVIPGYVIVQLDRGIATKFAMILASSLGLTLAVYHLLVRRSVVLGFLLGVTPITGVQAGATRMRAAMVSGLLAALVLPGIALPATPEGLWHAEGGAAQVEIRACGETLCGRVVWLRSPFDESGCPLRDRYNPDAALRQRPVLGLEVLVGLEPSPEDGASWSGGTIYDPASGRTYRCQLRLEDADRAQLRGYLGIPLIGRTTTWIRVGAEERVCQE